jgi:hypothetical protein
VKPEPDDTSDIPFLDQRSWAFGRSIAAGERLEVTFSLRPIEPGHFTGDVDVCNPNQDFSTVYADVVVRESSSTDSP